MTRGSRQIRWGRRANHTGGKATAEDTEGAEDRRGSIGVLGAFEGEQPELALETSHQNGKRFIQATDAGQGQIMNTDPSLRRPGLLSYATSGH